MALQQRPPHRFAGVREVEGPRRVGQLAGVLLPDRYISQHFGFWSAIDRAT